ncbi:bifunctional DNA primase/polymerase [Streptomyces sp. NPDC058459]|uniref:bifunctional DNA primase/polymerase n=1 Tax=Streptomyces sp. NPDC058459 TaxID=3346508 RepID=UPI00365D3E94
MDETTAGPETARIPPQRRESPLEAAVAYVEERHWEVLAGSWLEDFGGVRYCSCGDTVCPAPGAHPTRPDWATRATGSASVVRRMWQARPTASVLLPTGRTFDALSVPESTGFLALARMRRMELNIGPVTVTPDRQMQFFVLPGGAAKTPELVRRLRWTTFARYLVPLGEGRYVAAPPTRVGSRGAVQWACRPTPANRWLPDAEELVPPLAYACGRDF